MMMKKKMKKKDRISSLPDAVIQHILSFLPSTKETIQTSVLSKRWRKQWTQLPVLIFDLPGMRSKFSDGDMSRICRSIDSTLIFHDCSKLKKFHIRSYWYKFTLDPNYLAKLHFPITKEAEELILEIGWAENNTLPNFFFQNTSLIKLKMINCTLSPSGRVNWKRLKDLHIEGCSFPNQAIFEGVVSGCPLIESLEINCFRGFDQRLAIASKSLKRLVLVDPTESFDLEVSCPNLVEFYALIQDMSQHFSLSAGTVESVLSGSPLLELLELKECDCYGKQLVIDSNSLKKLILIDTFIAGDAVVISCPNLEELQLHSLHFKKIKLMNIPSLIRVTIDTNCVTGMLCYEKPGRMIVEQLHHVQELTIGPCFIKVLSALEMRSGLSSPSINNKCLTLDGGPNFVKNLPGIAYALRSSPKLENLVIILRRFECEKRDDDYDFPDLNISGENYWNSKGTAFNCLVSHLKIVKMFGLSGKDDHRPDLALNFVEFLLKNARVLEKMVIILEDRGADFVFKVSQKLLSFSRFSQHAVVELLCSESPRKSINCWHS